MTETCPVGPAALELGALDPFDDSFQQCPFPWFEKLRDEAPVFQIPGQGWYAVSTMDLARQVLMDTTTFSNQISRRTLPPPEVAAEVAAIRAEGYAYVPTMLLNDPPAHTRYRKLVNKAFTPRALKWMEPLIDDAAGELAGRLREGEVFDFITEFAGPLPVWAISRVLGLGDERRDDIRRWSDAATATIGAALAPERWPAVERDLLDYQQSIAAELEARRIAPVEDLLSIIAGAADAEAEPMGPAELVGMVRELLVAGNETTVRLLADIIRNLDGRPEEWQRVRDDPNRADAIVEESLRLASPSQGVFRLVTHDTTLGGVDIPAGSMVLLWLISANRDASVFENPDAFDPDRPSSRQHLAFGQGIHICVGAGLSRLEAGLAVRILAQHVDSITVEPEADLRYVSSFVLRGLTSLPVTITRHQQDGE